MKFQNLSVTNSTAGKGGVIYVAGVNTLSFEAPSKFRNYNATSEGSFLL